MPKNAKPRKPVVAARAAMRAQANGAGGHPILDPIITMNGVGIIQSASDSVEQVFGWKPGELYGRNVKMLIPEPRRSALDRYMDRYRNAVRAPVLERMRRFAAVRKDGTVIQIEMSMSRADLPVHAAPFFIGIFRDVSEQPGHDPDITIDRSQLQRLITEQTRALATANLRLQLADRLASLGTLAAGLGHDMNNVLLPVRAHLNAIEHAGIHAAAVNHLQAIRRSIAYLQHLSDGLHFLVLNPDAPDEPDEGVGTTDINQWWTQVGDLLTKALPKHVKVTASFPPRLPMVRIAPHWLTQAILNLIVNAGEAIPQGRRKPRVRIWASSSENGKLVRVGVTDNGRGMPHSIQRRALDLFFTTKPRSMGTGLGLPLARKVAVRAGGEIELSSEPGKGTSVVLILPIAPGSRASTDEAAEAKRTAALSVRKHRLRAFITQVLIGSRIDVKALRGCNPGRADIWVTEPTAPALKAALSWRKRRPDGMLVLVGAPSKASEKAWHAIGAKIVDQPSDFESLRHILGQQPADHAPTSKKRIRNK